MSSQIRVVKKRDVNVSTEQSTGSVTKTERQRERELVAVVETWIEEFELRRRSQRAVSLGLTR